jgi:hypothetical protein
VVCPARSELQFLGTSADSSCETLFIIPELAISSNSAYSLILKVDGGNLNLLQQYFDELSADLNRSSEQIRLFFKTHAPSAGSNREDLVANLLKDHIFPQTGVGSGLVMSASGEFSNQSDVVLYDQFSNGPLFRRSPVPIWLLEAVFGVIEVKTQLTPTAISDSVIKCRKFKNLQRHYDDSFGRQKIIDHLFIIWSFEAPKNSTFKRNLMTALTDVPHDEQPDFIIVPGRFLVRGGQYFDLSENGQIGSVYYKNRLAAVDGDPSKLLVEQFEMLDLGGNALSVFLYWLNSWLYAAGPRKPDILKYYNISNWGQKF